MNVYTYLFIHIPINKDEVFLLRRDTHEDTQHFIPDFLGHVIRW